MALRPGPKARRPSTTRRAALAVAVVALVAACGEPRYHYLKTSELDAYFRVPSDWTLFTENDFKDALARSELPPRLARVTWASAFDASGGDEMTALYGPTPAPVGFAQIQGLNIIEQGQLSFDALRNRVIPLDALLENGSAEPLNGLPDQPFESGDLHGTRATWAIEGEGEAWVYDQIALFDPDRERLFLLVFSCTTNCYDSNQRTIDEIVESLTVGEGV